MQKENSVNSLGLYFSLIIVLCLLVGKGITIVPTSIPFIIIAAGVIFFIGFFNANLAFVLLISAMLLSPEIIVAKVPSRDVIIRIEDFLIVVFFLAWIARSALVKKAKIFVDTPLNKIIFFYGAFCTLVTLRGMALEFVNPLKGTFYVLKLLEYFLIYFFVCSALKGEKQVKLFLKTFLFTFLIVNLYAISQVGTFGRVSAPFEGRGEPNTLGGYIVLLQGIILGLITHIKSSRKRWILAGLCLLSMITLAYTLSRASYAAFIPMYLTLIFFNKTRNRNLLIGSLIIMFIAGIFFFPQNVLERLQYTFIPQVQETIEPVTIGSVTLGPSASARIRSWIYIFGLWKNRPFLGYGITGVGFVDSQYVLTAAETGSLGFIVFVLLLVVISRRTLRIYKTTENDLFKGLALGFLAGHIGMLVHALTANTYIIIRIMEPYWFLAAMVMMIPQIDKKPKKTERPERPFRSEKFYPRASNFLVTSSRIKIH